jgi:hypothetical protein
MRLSISNLWGMLYFFSPARTAAMIAVSANAQGKAATAGFSRV